MAGSRSFSTQAADTLVASYLAQPKGERDLRKVLAAAKQGQLFEWGPAETEHHGPTSSTTRRQGIPIDPTIQAEIAAISQSQAYELLRADPRYQPTTLERIDAATSRNLDYAERVIAEEHAKFNPNWAKLRNAQRLLNQASQAERQKAGRREPAGGAGLAGLVG